MTDDIEKQLIMKHYPIKYFPTDIELQDLLLLELEEIFSKNGMSINNYNNLPKRTTRCLKEKQNHFIDEELIYDTDNLEVQANKMYLQLNDEERHASMR
jgi:hypothetical protein